MRSILASALSMLAAAGLGATTLEQLSLDQMIRQSTAIVHVKVSSASAALRGRNIYTFYQLQTIETLKGAAAAEVAVPGGSTAMIRQEVAGAPVLAAGGEYVIFLWSGSSGLPQVIGLSQGLFKVAPDSSGNPVLVRAALSGVNVVNKSGQAQTPAAVTITLAALKDEIRKAMGAK
jgi:hypothetical protein